MRLDTSGLIAPPQSAFYLTLKLLFVRKCGDSAEYLGGQSSLYCTSLKLRCGIKTCSISTRGRYIHLEQCRLSMYIILKMLHIV